VQKFGEIGTSKIKPASPSLICEHFDIAHLALPVNSELMPSYTQEFSRLPDTIQELVRYIVGKAHPREVILFGSRARGDHRPNSDFDIAVRGPLASQVWTEIQVDLEENPISLYATDVVLLEELGFDYQKNIKSEGKVLYG
jgi:predicted nucleotidyltransferase